MLTRRSLLAGSAATFAAGLAVTGRAKGGPSAGVTSAGAPLRIGKVALNVRDLDTMSAFYQQVVGLSQIESAGRTVLLGVDGAVLLELRGNADLRFASPLDAGLFHTAFLLPTRADLGSWLLNAVRLGVPIQGASDHMVSEAIYLADPEGNGIEIYWDRPSQDWTWRDGMVEMSTLGLDVQSLAEVARMNIWNGLPSGSSIGHVHLQVGDILAAQAFYSELLGMDIVHRVSGASFYSSGGYHHHIATNVWNSIGASTRTEGTTGLASFELIANNPTLYNDVFARLNTFATHSHEDRVEVEDPWGTTVILRSA